MEFNLVLIMFMYSLQVAIDLCKYLCFHIYLLYEYRYSTLTIIITKFGLFLFIFIKSHLKRHSN